MASMIKNERFYLLKVFFVCVFIHLETRLEPMIYFIPRFVCSFIWNFCQQDVMAYRCAVVFCNNSQTLLFAVAVIERMKKCKSVNLLFFLHDYVAQSANECN